MTEIPSPPCARGCTRARLHITDCDRDECGGCLPRDADHGLLCQPCHARLVQWIDAVPAQVHLLRLVVGKASPNSLPDIVETNAKIVTAWRTNDGQAHPSGLYARSTTRALAEDEPVRIGAIDVAREIEDWISVQVEAVADAHGAQGPKRALTSHEREHGKHGRWRWSDAAGEHVWHDPPPRFVLGSACQWLAAQVGRLEADPAIGDLWGELASLMSRAHALAPWRQEVAVLDGIECPECHKMGLVRYGGDDFVSCTKCNAHMDEERYWIWVKILNEERRAG